MNRLQRRLPLNQGFLMDIVFRETKQPDLELPDHQHDWFELVYVYDGTGAFFIDDNIYQMEKGACFLIPPHTVHHALPNADSPVTSTAVFFNSVTIPHFDAGDSFSLVRCYEEAKRSKSYKFQLSDRESSLIELQLECINQEKLRRSPGHRHAILLHLSQILLQLSRESANGREQDKVAQAADWMKDVLRHIDTNLQGDLSLSTLVDKYCISPPHLARTFKKLTGLTLTEYVNTKRIMKAVRMLQTTNLCVSTIAYECGMNSLPHFHSTFKKVMGHTPAHFRRHAADGKMA